MFKSISAFDLSQITKIKIRDIYEQLGVQDKYNEEVAFGLDLTEETEQKLAIFFKNQPVLTGKQAKDTFGLFYELEPKTITVKPEKIWLEPDYLPNLQECLDYKFDLFTRDELISRSEPLVFDIEIYNNWALIGFMGVKTGKLEFFELFADKEKNKDVNLAKLNWILRNYQTVGFNSAKFDLTIAKLALAGKSTQEMQRATSMLIENEMQPWDVLKVFKVQPFSKNELNHIDVSEVAKGVGISLKMYGARLGTFNLQDLPFPAGIDLSYEQQIITKVYNVNDLQMTRELFLFLEAPLTIRAGMSDRYVTDMRSKSDAQVAEAVIKEEYERKTGIVPMRPEIPDYESFKYQPPPFLEFTTPLMQEVFDEIKSIKIEAWDGEIRCPILDNYQVKINNTTYSMGLGGLHSCEKSISHYSDDEYEIEDIDVESYYPNIMLICKLFPPHLREIFLTVFQEILDTRLHAKHNGLKILNEMLKIVLNGTFGKLKDIHSVLFACRMLVGVTVTGQLSLLMLIESFEKDGISVVSANTDGIVVRYKKTEDFVIRQKITNWEAKTGFKMESTKYKSIHSRDVNNYFAIKDGSVKRKGVYAENRIDKNPPLEASIQAVIAYLTEGRNIEDVIFERKDVKEFLTIRKVNGGACKDGEYLGKVVRFYHSNSTKTSLVYANSGNKVPDSDACRPMMRLSQTIPEDLDYQWYIDKSYSILNEIGAMSY